MANLLPTRTFLIDVKYDVYMFNIFLSIYKIRGSQKLGQLVANDKDNTIAMTDRL